MLIVYFISDVEAPSRSPASEVGKAVKKHKGKAVKKHKGKAVKKHKGRVMKTKGTKSSIYNFVIGE